MIKNHRTSSLLAILIFGLILLVIGSRAPTQYFYGIDLSVFLTNLGLYVSVVVCLQWFFDNKNRELLIQEVREATVANVNIARSGIADLIGNTKKISYDRLFTSKSHLFIGFHYSTSIVDSYYDELQERAENGKPTTIIMCADDGQALDYLKSKEDKTNHIGPDLEKVINKINNINKSETVKSKITIRRHDAILRYSFVKNDDCAWIKLYRNSRGNWSVPGLYIQSPSDLFDFYSKDIENLMSEATHD